MYNDFAPVPIFALLSVALVGVAFFLQWILAPSQPTELKSSVYECGEEIEGSAWIQFNIRFYVVALIFFGVRR